MEEEELFGKLFGTVPLLTQGHLNMLLQTMNKEHAIYYLTQAVTHAYHSGVYTLGEAEVISKAIRTLNIDESENATDQEN